ncbi:response regulator [Aeromicrobium wangtongii]|uniref:response regulator n=1 Tax=Aeromicrobium wangtongii TaxID=2969247 RepID=UPI0020180D9F|nr:response regulator transcription factor [Aeromicrobium wangtongii]MCL3818339.1 response regulator transcription factor [Aeromicrobium wangtongii]
MTVTQRRCLIVDDSPTFCAAARGMLETAGMTVVGTATTLASAVEATAVHAPDVILVDVDLGGESGFDVVEALHAMRCPQRPAVLLVSTHDPEDFADMVRTSTAAGFVHKFDLSAEVITQALRSWRRGR